MKFGKYFTFMASTLMPLTGCSGTINDQANNPFSGPDANAGSISVINGEKALINGSNYFLYPLSNSKYSLELHDSSNDALIARNNFPVTIRVRGPETGLLSSFTEKTYQSAYSVVEEKNYGYSCIATINTDNGSVFNIFDSYYISEDEGLIVNRQVVVKESNSRDVGFASLFSLINAQNSKNIDDFEYFIPSILYKNSSNLGSGAIASNLYLDKIYVKETRMGLPMAMMRSTANKYYLSLSHAQPRIDVNGLVGGGASGQVAKEIQYGAFGFTMNPISVDFIYPCAEGPTTYDSGSTWARRYHPLETNVSHEYKIAIAGKQTESFNDALVDSYKIGFEHIDYQSETINNMVAYNQNIELFSEEYREFGTTNKSAGLPWQMDMLNKDIKGPYSFQMGFVGQQTSVGAHLYRTGMDRNDPIMKNKGNAILNFWTSSRINSSYFPYVWWDAANDSNGGAYRPYSSFLRCMVDGMEGILDAYNYAKNRGETREDWMSILIRFTNNLIAKQNADGSFYRAYATNGNVANVPSDNNVQGSSKLNTPVAIRFLAKMYYATNNNAYKTAALSAADFSYTELYENLGKYVGGTPDNPNVVDKEAAIYAMYGFRNAYELSNLEKYKKAMIHATICSLSWTFVYDYACPSPSTNMSAYNPFEEGNVIGFSVIATGHGASDNFSSYVWYDLYKIYEDTDDDFFKKTAILIQNVSKLNTDFNGIHGFAYRALTPEATRVSDFSYQSVNVWLPWQSIANINPITYFYDEYGSFTIEDYLNK